MPKKKGKAKAKKAKDKKAKVQDGERKPTEKELLETKIEQLREELKSVDADLEQHKSTLQDVKSQLSKESDSKVSCVAHLERTLQAWRRRRLEAQDKIETERDLAQLADERSRVQLVNAERDARVAKSIFLQQKGDLEGKLSLLEDLRQERKKDLEKLRKEEHSLRESRALAREKTRDEEREMFEKLLEGRRTFTRMCRDELREEFSRVHRELRVPVHAERQLRENVRLRGECEKATQELMKVQDDKRNLKKLLKSAELEQEIQSCAEQSANQKMALQKEQILHLRQSIQQMTLTDVSSSIPETVNRQSPDSERRLIDQKINVIKENEVEQCRLADRQRDMDAILNDQAKYKASLERQIDEKVDKNGFLISALLRAGKVFQARTEGSFDIELLNQIRDLLNLSSFNVSNDQNTPISYKRAA